MSFLVEGFLDDHSLSATIATAREAFAKAIEWHDTGRFRNVTINDDSKSYSIVAFALAMAHLEIAKTGNDAGDATAEARHVMLDEGWHRKSEIRYRSPTGA
jgi:hypothetical protein